MASLDSTQVLGDLVVSNQIVGGSITATEKFKGTLEGNASSATTLNGLTASVAELNHVDGVTSNVQTQLNGKANKTHSHGYTLGDEIYFDGSALVQINNTDYIPGLWAARTSANSHDYPVHSLMYIPLPANGETLRVGFLGLNDSHQPAFFEFSVTAGYSGSTLVTVNLTYEGSNDGAGEVWIAPLIPN